MNKEEFNKRVYLYSVKIIKFLDTLPDERLFWVIGDQILRRATSIGANIIETQAGSSKGDLKVSETNRVGFLPIQNVFRQFIWRKKKITI